jgi:soluble calcium-activated nucleotidase 1
MGTNLLLVATEDFRDIRVVKVGPLQPDRGFTALRKIPGTEDHFLALKVREVGDETATWLATFDSKGNMLLDPKLKGVDENGFLLVDAEIKYEGLEFV